MLCTSASVSLHWCIRKIKLEMVSVFQYSRTFVALLPEASQYNFVPPVQSGRAHPCLARSVPFFADDRLVHILLRCFPPQFSFLQATPQLGFDRLRSESPTSSGQYTLCIIVVGHCQAPAMGETLSCVLSHLPKTLLLTDNNVSSLDNFGVPYHVMPVE